MSARGRGRWCWVVVTGSHFVQALSVGASSALGIMLNAWVDYFDVSVGEVSTIIALIPIFGGIASPVAGVLCGRVGYRPVAIAGAVMTSLSMFATSFANNLTHLYIFFGIFTSIGIGLVYTSSIMVLGSYFTKHLVLANGISFAGISTGQFVLPPLIEYLFSEFGWRGGILILSAIKMNLVACCVLYRPNPKRMTENNQISHKVDNDSEHTLDRGTLEERQLGETTSEKRCANLGQSISLPTLCQNVPYLLSLLVITLLAMVAFGGYVFMIPRATDAGIEPFQAAVLVTLSGASGAIGTLGHSILINRKFISMHSMFLGSIVTCAVSLFTNPLSDHLAFLVINVCLFGMTLGVITPLATNPIPRQIVGWTTPSLVDPAVGVAVLMSALGQGTGMIFAGKLHDISGSFTVPFLAFGGILSLATVIFVPIFKLMRDMQKMSKVEDKADDE